MDPTGPEASAVPTRPFHDADRGEVLAALRAGLAADARRFRRLLSLVRGHRPRLAPREDYLWLEQALQAELRRGALWDLSGGRDRTSGSRTAREGGGSSPWSSRHHRASCAPAGDMRRDPSRSMLVT
ncbi:hypothetical protein GCM10010405_09870 [Streptomyces macrosporus]|uniref:Uncharacterized protein n=1 Tax=Streptomyces macrosporus TaxID=44032 RepID=A0ABN3JGG6_9ACTN